MEPADQLPKLTIDRLGPARDYLRDAALVMSSLQRAFLPKHPRDWQYGLEVTMRGLSTQAFSLDGAETRAGLDLVKHKLRLGGNKWLFKDYDGPELFKEIRVWLESQGLETELEEPKFSSSRQYDTEQADAYAAALWWLEAQFRRLKNDISEGVTSPILLYPHHFDLSLVWFPYDDERQLALGFSTGDETIAEPYLYLTAYPEPEGFRSIKLPKGAYWQTEGFSGAILPYAALRTAKHPDQLFKHFSGGTLAAARPLFG